MIFDVIFDTIKAIWKNRGKNRVDPIFFLVGFCYKGIKNCDKIKNMKKIFIILIVLAGLTGAWLGLKFLIKGDEESVSCTMDVKQCPDGSYVGRVPPECDFAPCPETRAVKLYYYNYELDRDEFGNAACSRNGLVAVERQIPITQTPIQDTIKLLLLGELTEAERAQGIDTEYPLEGLSLKGASLKDGVLTLEFDDPNNKTVGGSCRVGILRFQIEATAKQFPEVQQVRFLPEEIFQP